MEGQSLNASPGLGEATALFLGVLSLSLRTVQAEHWKAKPLQPFTWDEMRNKTRPVPVDHPLFMEASRSAGQ
jgi:hypothetical protein